MKRMNEISIEQCEFSYRCPKVWGALLETNIDSVRYCDQCDRNVYLSESTANATVSAATTRLLRIVTFMCWVLRDGRDHWCGRVECADEAVQHKT